jgi:hypothetical protein
VSAAIALLTSIAVIAIYGPKEWLRMMFQVVLTVTLATSIIGGVIRKLEKMLD